MSTENIRLVMHVLSSLGLRVVVVTQNGKNNSFATIASGSKTNHPGLGCLNTLHMK
ncbi:hypothetical protein PR003_g24297 [Phytophthora rubi]|uniref:Uncharacterized protein n=1 Tax=Phytophthora rubi TaxID=129364 RepID=A0A6A3K3X7_9STRA|nr:hypothetical protein PR002_g18674 [Phytophthora rubi]KAE9000307.1 hypothetical protein PR001_g18821 [Phytophthora rubi]KAE9294278.1 hypothetical protein PR003_g24297 [Phytophthora rubi]